MDKMETDLLQMPVADATPFKPTLPPVLPSSGHKSVVELLPKKSDMYYSMAHKDRGKAILINMIKFKKLGEREGTQMDMQSLRTTFTYLQFRVVELENKSRNDLMLDLEREAQDENLKYDDCLVVVIMTHGGEDSLFATDSPFKLENVTEIFMANNCKALAGKPKLFFIQACRGEGMEEAFKAFDAGANPKDVIKPFYYIPNTCDILEFHSSSEGKKAVRNTESGSWFIQKLATELHAHGFKENLLDILTLVIKGVAFDCEHQGEKEIWKQQPVLTSTLSRIVKFVQKTNNTHF